MDISQYSKQLDSLRDLYNDACNMKLRTDKDTSGTVKYLSAAEINSCKRDTLKKSNIVNSWCDIIASVRTAVVSSEKMISEYKKLQEENNKLNATNEKLQEYSDIFSKVEECFTDWRSEITSDTKGKLINIPEIKDEILKCVPAIVKEVSDNSQSSLATKEIQEEITTNILSAIVKSTVKEAEKTWSSFFDTSKSEMKKQTNEAKEQSKKVEVSILEAKRQQAVENIEREKRKRNIL